MLYIIFQSIPVKEIVSEGLKMYFPYSEFDPLANGEGL